jgi:DNA-binding MarR family transcriptional regulator
MGRSIEELFLHLKPVKLMVRLKDPTTENYASALASQADCTYSHAVRIIQKMEEEDLIETEKKGRRKQIELTVEGEEIAENLADTLASM